VTDEEQEDEITEEDKEIMRSYYRKMS